MRRTRKRRMLHGWQGWGGEGRLLDCLALHAVRGYAWTGLGKEKGKACRDGRYGGWAAVCTVQVLLDA